MPNIVKSNFHPVTTGLMDVKRQELNTKKSFETTTEASLYNDITLATKGLKVSGDKPHLQYARYWYLEP